MKEKYFLCYEWLAQVFIRNLHRLRFECVPSVIHNVVIPMDQDKLVININYNYLNYKYMCVPVGVFAFLFFLRPLVFTVFVVH